MKKKILLITLLLTMFTGGYALATTVNGQWNGLPIVKIFSGGKELVPTDTPGIIFYDRTMVPISLLNQLGILTEWDAANYSVTVKLPETPEIVHPALTFEQLNKIAESVFEVYGYKADPTKFEQGSGVVINNMLITNSHIGGTVPYIDTKIADQMIRSTDIVFKNDVTDLMAVKIDGQKSLKYSTELPKVGDTVYTIGFPLKKFKITQGKVLELYDDAGKIEIIQDAITNFGSSGGALINTKGEVIGITTWKSEDGKTSGAVPMKYVQDEFNKLN